MEKTFYKDINFIELLELAVIVATKDRVEYISPIARDILMLDDELLREELFFSDLFANEDEEDSFPLNTERWSTQVKILRKFRLKELRIIIKGLLIDQTIDKAVYMIDYADFSPNRRRSDIMSNVVASCPVTIVITDLNGVIVYVNDKFESLTGYSKEEAIGLTPAVLKSGVHEKSFYDSLWQTIQSGEIWKGVFYNKKKNGSFFWEEASIQLIRGLSGRMEYYLAIKEDITERVNLEERLREKNRSLQETLKILQDTQSKMIQQEKMASVGQLAAGVAHEINNPLGFITSNISTLAEYAFKMLSYISKLEKMALEEKKEEMPVVNERLCVYKNQDKINFITEDLGDLITDVQSGLERVRKIVQGLRNFSRIDQIHEQSEYDLNEGISTTLVVSNNEIKYDAEVSCIFASDLPLVMANGGQINQVILNLLLNAVQSIRESKADGLLGNIKIETFANNNYVTLRITDDGTGMSEQTLRRLFEPFYTTKPPGVGTGLGLSICYDIVVNKHKGILTALNNMDKGACFELSLPIVQGENLDE